MERHHVEDRLSEVFDEYVVKQLQWVRIPDVTIHRTTCGESHMTENGPGVVRLTLELERREGSTTRET